MVCDILGRSSVGAGADAVTAWGSQPAARMGQRETPPISEIDTPHGFGGSAPPDGPDTMEGALPELEPLGEGRYVT